MAKKEYHQGELKYMVAAMAQIFKQDPKYVRAVLEHNFPALKDPSKCPHCKAGMEMKVYRADMHSGLLILRMAQQVRANMAEGMTFTEANRVHVPTLETSDSIRHHVTIASYLNLVKQPEKWTGSGYWLLTGWGWAALRGEEILSSARYFRGTLVDRGVEKTTLGQMFRTYSDKIAKAVARGKAVRQDHRANVADYEPIEWAELGGYAKGELFD